MTERTASGCLIGLALGDALAAPVEFLKYGEILRRFPPDGPREPEGDPALVTDDTQMALALGEALLEAGTPLTAETLEPPLRAAFVAWMRSPDNNRAPGNTCMTACGRLAAGQPWLAATVTQSKGAGANMRVAPAALAVPGLDAASTRLRAALSQFQAALTHGHATGLAAADLTAQAIALLRAGAAPTELPGLLRAYAQSQREVYHGDWLGALWQRAGGASPVGYIAAGWDECLGVLDRLEAALARPDRAGDPCRYSGEGWVAEEGFATGLLCFLLFPADPVAAIRRAAASNGDSDTIACLTGAFAGAHHGLAAWPGDWVARIEYHNRLMRLGAAWDQ